MIPQTGTGCATSVRTGEKSTHSRASIEHTAIAMIVGQSPRDGAINHGKRC